MRLILSALCLLCCGLITFAQDQKSISGKFLIFSDAKQVGDETYNISRPETGGGSDALELGGNAVNFTSQTEYKGAHPSSFMLEQGSAKVVVSITGAQVKVTGAQETTGQTDPDALILENNVWYQYYFLVQRYDRQKGGVQQFKAFVPSIMQTIPMTLELKGFITIHPAAAVRYLQYRAVAANSLAIDIITTEKDGELVYLGVPSQKAEVVREDQAAAIGEWRAAIASATKAATIDYSAPAGASFTAEEVTVAVKDFKLAGTLLLPKSCARPCPAVVTITGSGQETRDEPIPIPGLEKYRPMRQIAEALAARGIAVLRVDDRGVGGSTGRETLLQATTSDFADDVRAEVAYLRSRKEIDPNRIALIGHSEGGTIAPMVAAADPRLAAIVLMAGAGKSGAEISMFQMKEALDAQASMTQEERDKKLAEHREMIRAVREGGDLSKYPAEVRYAWIKEFFTYDPIPTIRKVRQPVLIVQGALDKQITADQATLLADAARGAGNKDVTLKIYPNLNHLFLPAKTGAFSEYSVLETTSIGPEVLDTLSDWLVSRLHAGK